MRTRTGHALVAATLTVIAVAAAGQDPISDRFGSATGTEAQPIVVALPDVVITDCEANVTLEYTQRGAIARVEGLIENDTCAASAGSFTVSIRTANDRFEQSTRDYPETWQRDDDQPVAFSRDYEIGDNVDLIRVRTLKSKCKCAAAE